MGGGGGWPLTVFLTPELRPFFGGTYFPPEDRFGMPGFPKLLRALDQAWRSQPKEIEDQARQFEEGLKHLGAYGLESNPAPLAAKDIVDAGEYLEQRLDGRFGGFGTGPKFPNPMNVALLLRAYRRTGRKELLSSALLTLERMADGGIYDQLGGGFHRYSVADRWLVAHFEEILYHNPQPLHLYPQAQQISPRPLYN